MRVTDNGSFFRVTFGKSDAEDFSQSWPCSSVRGRGAFTFQKSNGDLVDAEGSASKGDGSEWVAFADDCKLYGEIRLREGSTIAEASTAVYNRRHGKG